LHKVYHKFRYGKDFFTDRNLIKYESDEYCMNRAASAENNSKHKKRMPISTQHSQGAFATVRASSNEDKKLKKQ